MVGLVHSKNNQFADSATDLKGQKWGGLSPLGRQLISRANRLGMIVDMSHAHDDALAQAIISTPIILSHSGAAFLHQHPRNVPDDLLKKLARSGGVIQINSLSAYLRESEQIQTVCLSCVIANIKTRRAVCEKIIRPLSQNGARSIRNTT